MPTIANLKELEDEVMVTTPDFVTATAWSGINQALYDLLAKREQVPVWRLFCDKASVTKMPLYTTINRTLKDRTDEEYLNIVAQVVEQGFQAFKCAPFEKVQEPVKALAHCGAGLETLRRLRERFPALEIRVDFHERFLAEDFSQIVPELEELRLDWIEEPFPLSADYLDLRSQTKLRIAAGELFWGADTFRTIADKRWVDITMPDVKHVGGFGPLLKVLELSREKVEVSPHNPSGPVSTAATLHAGVLHPECVRSIEYAFDKTRSRRRYGEVIEDGFLYLNDQPGWGIDPEIAVTR